jgi:RNA polymerase sigma-70 factor, ECF subfamily
MTETPASLLERLRMPEERQAWNRFVALYTPVIYHWARQMGLQESDASDLVQDVFTLLLKKLPEFTYDRQGSFHAWLKTVTLNHWRSKRRLASTRREAGGRLPEPAAKEAEAFWEQEYRQHLVAQALRVMQSDFEPNTWQACWQLVVDGLPASQVAKKLGVSVGTVYASKCRVLARLRQELAGLMD